MTITNGAGGLTVCAELVDELSIANAIAQVVIRTPRQRLLGRTGWIF
jgi:hypothetical protein